MNGMGRAAGCYLFFEVYRVKGLQNDLIYDNKIDPNQYKFYPVESAYIDL